MSSKRQIFISYARADGKKYARKLIRTFREAGYECWWDKDIDPTKDFAYEIERAIERSDLFCVLATRDVGREDSFVRKEIATAQRLGKPIFVLKFPHGHIPVMVATHTWLKWNDNSRELLKQVEILWSKIEEPKLDEKRDFDHFAKLERPKNFFFEFNGSLGSKSCAITISMAMVIILIPILSVLLKGLVDPNPEYTRIALGRTQTALLNISLTPSNTPTPPLDITETSSATPSITPNITVLTEDLTLTAFVANYTLLMEWTEDYLIIKNVSDEELSLSNLIIESRWDFSIYRGSSDWFIAPNECIVFVNTSTTGANYELETLIEEKCQVSGWIFNHSSSLWISGFEVYFQNRSVASCPSSFEEGCLIDLP